MRYKVLVRVSDLFPKVTIETILDNLRYDEAKVLGHRYIKSETEKGFDHVEIELETERYISGDRWEGFGCKFKVVEE